MITMPRVRAILMIVIVMMGIAMATATPAQATTFSVWDDSGACTVVTSADEELAVVTSDSCFTVQVSTVYDKGGAVTVWGFREFGTARVVTQPTSIQRTAHAALDTTGTTTLVGFF